jgi:hypothetical protein
VGLGTFGPRLFRRHCRKILVMPKRKPSPARLAALFEQLGSDATRLFSTFGAKVPREQLIWLLRHRSASFGARLIRLSPENTAKAAPSEIENPRTLTYEDFICKVRKVNEECFEMLIDNETMEPETKVKRYGRRLVNRGRKLLMLSELELIDREALVRLIEHETRREQEAARLSAAGTAMPPPSHHVTAIDDPQKRLAAKDQSRSRFVLNVGSDRVVFECMAKMDRRTAPISHAAARVLPMNTNSSNKV